MTTDVLTAASGRWREILEALAGLRAEQLSNRHQPCPACGGRDRFRFDDRDGNGSWFCNQCGGKDHLGGGGTRMDLLMRVRRWSFRKACEEVERHLGLEPGGSGRHRPQPVSTGNGGKIPTPAATGLPGHGGRPWRPPELPPPDALPPVLDPAPLPGRQGPQGLSPSGVARWWLASAQPPRSLLLRVASTAAALRPAWPERTARGTGAGGGGGGRAA